MFEFLSGKKKGDKPKEAPIYEVLETPSSSHHEHGEGTEDVERRLVLTEAGRKMLEKAEEERGGRRMASLKRERDDILNRMRKIIDAQSEGSGSASKTKEPLPPEFAELTSEEISEQLDVTTARLSALRAKERSKWHAPLTRSLFRQRHPDEARLAKKIEQLNSVNNAAVHNDIIDFDRDEATQLRNEYRDLQASLEQIEKKMGL